MKVRVFVLGDAGLVGVYLTTIPFIPARSTFYLGNEPVSMSTVQRATGVRAVIAGSARRARLPAHFLRRPHRHRRGGRIHGTVRNHYKRGIVTERDEAVRRVLRPRRQGDRRRPARKALPSRRSAIAPKKSATFSATIGLRCLRHGSLGLRSPLSPGACEVVEPTRFTIRPPLVEPGGAAHPRGELSGRARDFCRHGSAVCGSRRGEALSLPFHTRVTLSGQTLGSRPGQHATGHVFATARWNDGARYVVAVPPPTRSGGGR